MNYRLTTESSVDVLPERGAPEIKKPSPVLGDDGVERESSTDSSSTDETTDRAPSGEARAGSALAFGSGLIMTVIGAAAAGGAFNIADGTGGEGSVATTNPAQTYLSTYLQLGVYTDCLQNQIVNRVNYLNQQDGF